MMRIGSPLLRLVVAVYARWRQRPRYTSYADMPDWRLAVVAIAATVDVYMWTPLVVNVGPSYLRAAQSPGAFSSVRAAATGVGLGFILLITALRVWYFGNVSVRCSKLLHERWFR
jgi:hypothetical protein